MAGRRVLAAALAGAVALCLVGVALHTPGRPGALLEQAAEPPGQAGQAQLYGYLPTDTPHYDRKLKGEAAYLGALDNARASNADLESMVNHYSNLPNSYFEGDQGQHRLMDAVNTVHDAHRMWSGGYGSLEQLDKQIKMERESLERMRVSKHVLKRRSELIKGEVERLMGASRQVGNELDTLKGKYSTQITDMRNQYSDAAKALTLEREAAERELSHNKKEQRMIGGEIATATEKASYFVEQADHLREDVESMRERTKGLEVSEKDSKASIFHSEDLDNQQKSKAAEARAGRAKARLEEGAIAEIAKMRATADAINTARGNKAIRIASERGVQVALKSSAEVAAEAAVQEKDDQDRHIIDLKDQIKKDEEKIYGFKAEGSASTVAASENTLRMHEEKRVYDKIMEKMSYIEGKTRNAREIVDTAESKAAAITTQGQVAELKAQTAMAMADQRKQQSEKIIKDGEVTVEENQKLAEEEEDKKEKLMQETMDAIAQKLDAESKANMAYSEAHFKAQQGAALLFTAQSKRDKAEKLMESVTRLSALAREAAEVAAAQKIKAQAASYSAGVQAGAVRTVKNPAVTVHVLPHKPANSYLMH